MRLRGAAGGAMAELKAREVEAYVRRGPKHAIVLIYGPDRGLVSETATALAKASGVPLDDPFSAIRLDAADVESDPPRLADEARTMSMFGGGRLVWVRGSGGQKFASAIADLCANPPPDCLVLVEAGELRKDSALRRTAEKAASAVTLPCYADEGRGIDTLIDEVMGASGKTLELDARHWLRARLGADRLASRGELEKLVLFAGAVRTITLADVQASVGDVSGQSVDLVVEAVLTGSIDKLDAEFSKLAATKTPAFLAAAALIRQLQTLVPLREMVERDNKRASELVAGLKPPIYGSRRDALEQALSGWSLDRIGRAQERLADAILQSRRNAALEDAVIRHNLLALAVEARRAGAANTRR
jgi:DNA polymerase III subunit delta